jgi:hypothetical protein
MDISCKVSTPLGMMEINDGQIYRLADSTGATRNVQWRKQTIASWYTHGEFVVNAVLDNVQETVAVYVYGSDSTDLRASVERLTEAFSQFEYSLTWDTGGDSYTWRCFVSDFTVDTRREFQHATMALVTFAVPRYPAIYQT